MTTTSSRSWPTAPVSGARAPLLPTRRPALLQILRRSSAALASSRLSGVHRSALPVGRPSYRAWAAGDELRTRKFNFEASPAAAKLSRCRSFQAIEFLTNPTGGRNKKFDFEARPVGERLEIQFRANPAAGKSRNSFSSQSRRRDNQEIQFPTHPGSGQAKKFDFERRPAAGFLRNSFLRQFPRKQDKGIQFRASRSGVRARNRLWSPTCAG
jgi:hypothetical protein